MPSPLRVPGGVWSALRTTLDQEVPSQCGEGWHVLHVPGLRLQTPTTRTPGIAPNAGKCRARANCPAPTIPIRITSDLPIRPNSVSIQRSAFSGQPEGESDASSSSALADR